MNKIEFAKKIREFEINLLKEYKEKKIKGTIHCCIGQELDIVDIIFQLTTDDMVTSNHRSHGHFLAYTKNFDGLYKEIKGQFDGVNNGVAFAQHLHQYNFYSTGIQGGLLPIACGWALAQKINKTNNIAVCFIGDGTLGQGILYESLNLSSLWNLPICFVLENNNYAMSTHISQAIAGNIADRFKAFGLKESKNNIRENLPSFKIIDTYRFCGHSGNDNKCYRTKEEELEWLKKDKLEGYLCQDIILQK